MNDDEQPAHVGWATKCGGFIKTWRRRWFVLTPKYINYYKAPGGRLKGRIPLDKVTEVSPYPDCPKKCAFKVVVPSVRTYQVSCDSDQEMREWVREINKIMSGSNEVVKIEDFDILKVLGKGTYGKVQLVRNKKNNQIYAMKSISKRLLAEYDLVERTLTERDVLLKANHPFIVSAKYCFQTETKIFLVLDYVAGGELFARLREEHKFSQDRAKFYIGELLLAIGYLHSIGVVHRDLKPENILFDKDGYIKLTDFGLVKEKMTKQSKTSTFCGTPEYLAPEIIEGNDYGMAVDWWALGTLAYEMLYGYPPFYDTNTNQMYRYILRDDVTFPAEATPEAKDLLTKLLDKNPETRLGSGPGDMEEIKCHPFFASLNWKALLQKSIPMEWKPQIKSITDVSQFDRQFTCEAPKLTYEDPSLVGAGTQQQLQGFTYVNDN